MKDAMRGMHRSRRRGHSGKRRWFSAGALWLLVASQGAPLSAVVEESIDEQRKSDEQSAKSQEKIDELSDETDAMSAKYRATLQETRSLDVYNRQLEVLLVSQEKEMNSLREQVDRVTAIGREVIPLMLRMIERLEDFVDVDLPFLNEERHKRVADLRALMDRADVTISEKYRRVLEAYQIENEFGRTIEAYRGTLDSGGSPRTVDFLRIGRMTLLYQTLDGRESGVWDRKSRSWQVLGDRYRLPIRQGLRMARKQAAPDLILVPLTAASTAP
jgi:hypothetical protein